MLIKTYSAGGQRIRDYSEEAIAELVRKGRMVVTRSVKGRLLSATFLPAETRAVQKTAHMGQRYSFDEKLPSGRRAWKHADLLSPETIERLAGEPLLQNEIDLYIRAIFRAVPLSCLNNK